MAFQRLRREGTAKPAARSRRLPRRVQRLVGQTTNYSTIIQGKFVNTSICIIGIGNSIGNDEVDEIANSFLLKLLFVDWIFNAGAPIFIAPAILGHKHFNTTLGYARLYDGTVAADYGRTIEGFNNNFM